MIQKNERSDNFKTFSCTKVHFQLKSLLFNNFLQQVGDTPTVTQATKDGLQWAFRSLYMQVSLLKLEHHFPLSSRPFY